MTPGRQVVVVLDDDPTGTQGVTDVPVLLRHDRAALAALMAAHDAVFVLTNTRAMPEADAVALVREITTDALAIAADLDAVPLVVQRGDSTMRGHVFAEVDAAGGREAVVVFSPAFPAGGRRTRDGVHEVRVDGEWINAADTEFAGDPVFGYRARSQVEYVAERGARIGRSVAAHDLGAALRTSSPGKVLLPDVLDDEDVRVVADAIRTAIDDGVRVVVRSAAPLAAMLAGAKSTALLSDAAVAALDGGPAGGTLVVVGSHTGLTSSQLDGLHAALPTETHELSTDAALADASAAGADLAARALPTLRAGGTVVIASERHRRAEHDTLAHGEAVMAGLTHAVAALHRHAGTVVAKGGITSAEVVRTGMARSTAWVAGQVLPGVSLWILADEGVRPPGMRYAVLPGNIGDADTLRAVVALMA